MRDHNYYADSPEYRGAYADGANDARTALAAILDDIEDYLQDREDVRDGSYGESHANEEMQLLARLREARHE